MAGRGRPTKLTKPVLEEILKNARLRLNHRQISDAIGIDQTTFSRWLARGYEAKKGIYRKLIEELAKVQEEILRQAVSVVYDHLLYGSVEIEEREVLDKFGKVQTLTTKKIKPPNASIAIKVLERISTDWAQKHNIQIDTTQLLIDRGVDPDMLKELVVARLKALDANRSLTHVPPQTDNTKD